MAFSLFNLFVLMKNIKVASVPEGFYKKGLLSRAGISHLKIFFIKLYGYLRTHRKGLSLLLCKNTVNQTLSLSTAK